MVSIHEPEFSTQSLRLSTSRDALALKAGNSANSSRASLELHDEDDTITSSRPLVTMNGKKESQEQNDLTFLAISTHMTEMSYGISDIQTRIFEIQELRHKTQASGDATGASSAIDQSLITLDERIELVTKGMKTINDALEPYHQAAPTPTVANSKQKVGEQAGILRKHMALVAEWEAVQDESETLREELKEDKWLTVFRTVTDQADGMMSSLEKAVNRCQEFIWQVHRFGSNSQSSLSASHSIGSDYTPPSLGTFNTLLESFEAKKKHYVPATSKVLSIIDKGVQDRVTKNGETLRRHAESAQRWKNLKQRIARVEGDMEGVRKILMGEETPSEVGSVASTTFSRNNGYLATPHTGRSSSASTISRSMSPLKKFARKITGGSSKLSPKHAPVTPLTINKTGRRTPSSEPISTFGRKSIFSLKSLPQTPTTPDKLGHKHTYSFTPDPSPPRAGSRNGAHSSADMHPTIKGTSRQPWNSSTRIEGDGTGTLKGTPPRRPSVSGLYGSDIPPVPTLSSQYARSSSRMSNASAGGWTPGTSSSSTAPIPAKVRPPSRNGTTPSRAQTPSRPSTSSHPPVTAPPPPTPRARPTTPSQIPGPAKHRNFSSTQSEGGWDDNRPYSPAFSTSGQSAHAGGLPPRPPSRSMIPVPKLSLSTASRPGSALSQYRPSSPQDSPFKLASMRAQTPESSLKARVALVPFFGAARSRSGSTAPPSSYREGARTPVNSRPSSRNGAYTPNPFDDAPQSPLHTYTPGNPKDPLDVEVANIVNSIPHGLLIERVDPPLKGPPPKDGEEVRAQYAFSNALSRKVVTCRLTTMVRTSTKTGGVPVSTKKVMCRVGGGWQDLQLYVLSRLDVG